MRAVVRFVAKRRHQAGHVQGAAGGGLPPGNQAMAAPRTAVTIDRGDSDQRCGLAAIEGSQFWHRGQQDQGGQATDADHQAESSDFLSQRFVAAHQFSESSVELFQLPI